MAKNINIEKIQTLTREANEGISQKEFEKLSAKIDKTIEETALKGKNLTSISIPDNILPATIDRIVEEYKEFNASFRQFFFEDGTDCIQFSW